MCILIRRVYNGVINSLHCVGRVYLKFDVNVMTYVIKEMKFVEMAHAKNSITNFIVILVNWFYAFLHSVFCSGVLSDGVTNGVKYQLTLS